MAFSNRLPVQFGSLKWLRRLLSIAIPLALAGCNFGEGVSRTTEPRVESVKAPSPHGEMPKVEKVPTRILGAIAAVENGQSWFFKMTGPAEAIAKKEPAFDEFLSSIKFDSEKDKPVAWTLPEGWREGDQKGRYATLLTGPEADAIEISVMLLGGDLLANVNRWRAQVGLEPVKQDTLQSCCREITTKSGKKITRVDVSGMAGPGPAMPPFMHMKK
jgi:hypothetical protein